MATTPRALRKALKPTSIPLSTGIVRSPTTRLPTPLLCQHHQQRWNSTSKEEPRKLSFHGQVWDSTHKRIQEETAETERYARERDQKREREGGGFLADSVPMAFVWTLTALIFYYIGTGRYKPEDPRSTTTLEQAPKVKHNTSKANMTAAWSDFVAILGEENVSVKDADMERHSGSNWSSHKTLPEERPFMVVYPGSTEEVSRIAKVCFDRRIPMTAFSGGTSLEGHFAPTRGGVCIAFERMDKILKINKADLDVVVQPAVGWEDLNEIIGDQGLFFPPDPGPGAQIGGMVGTGCSGTNTQRYGTMREWVINLTVVLADGTIIKTRQRPRKSSAGYDLNKMFIGSEGTLGLVTEATLKVTVKPQFESVAVCSFPSIRAAADTVAKVMGEGIPIAAIEILDDVQMRCINLSGSTSRSWKEAPTLFFKFNGTQSGVKEQIALVRGIAKSYKSTSFEFASNKDEQHELWSARKTALWSVMAIKEHEDDMVWTTDVAVPLSRLPDIIDETKADMVKNNVLGSIVGHVGDGNFHTILLYNEAGRPAVEGVVHRMIKRAIEMDGTVTGEHGVGLVKRDYLPKELGQSTVDAMRRLKLAFDPLCLLNCDKIVRMEPKSKDKEKSRPLAN